MNYMCRDESRRNAIKGHPRLNGIDFLEVVDNPNDPLDRRQTTLIVHLINDFDPAYLPALSAVIEGGERILNIQVIGPLVPAPVRRPASPPIPTPTRTLLVTVNKAGDFSTYTLRLVKNFRPNLLPGRPILPEFELDPILAAVEFSFKVNCPSDFDCKPAPINFQRPVPEPDINYLAKDYASFRQLMLDRMAFLMPDWQERNPADLGITLIELLAYVGDYLSYQQDAIGTETYLNTARLRTSVRRHARLVDYFMHDGCNARVWVQVQLSVPIKVGSKVVSLELKKEYDGRKTQFLTRGHDLGTSSVLAADSPDYQKALASGAQVFELMHDETLFSTHNEMPFYTWGNTDCCLPAGATRATLAGRFLDLKAGQVLILAEVLGPRTGLKEDADPARRHPVRLTKVSLSMDPLGVQATPPEPLPDNLVPFVPQVTHIEWHPADALPFSLCLSSRNGTNFYDNVSKALGNIVLADHGLTIQEQQISSLMPDTVPPARFRPRLAKGPLTQAVPYKPDHPPASATEVMHWSMRDPKPAIILHEQDPNGRTDRSNDWCPQRDLLSSESTAREFVVETETDGMAYLRFGNDVLGLRPPSGTIFRATYRVGNGLSGNIGTGSLAHLVTHDSAITLDPSVILGVQNLLPAWGGTAPETIEEVRQKAPAAFRRQERAVTASDYEEISQRVDATIQHTACTFRWTGSWHTAFLTVDREGGQAVDPVFEQQIRAGLERYRMAGHDLEVDGPTYVPLEMEMEVCIDRSAFRSDVKTALLRVFNRNYQPNGRMGLFHPDQFTFGQTVYLSPFYAAAQAIPGVVSVQITRFRRQGSRDTEALTSGKLTLGRLEIARLDNDPNFPDRGVFNLIMKGGR